MSHEIRQKVRIISLYMRYVLFVFLITATLPNMIQNIAFLEV